jgi:hypothetical protein
MAVLDHQEEQIGRTITQAGVDAADAWAGIVTAFDVFLESISCPIYQRLCFVEGPAALGFEDWWDCGERYEIAVIRTLLDRAAVAGIIAVTDLDMLAHVLFGAVTAGVLAMVRSDTPDVERQRFRTVMLDIMAGLVTTDPAPNLGTD